MKLLLDDKATRGHNLNANEACIFAAILKCTRAGRGWYVNYRELAASMPFVINRTTVYRAIQKLITLGLIKERENKTLYAVQIAQESVQNAQECVQIAQENVQIALPPNNPLNIDNNMNEKEKEQPRALCTHDGEMQQSGNLLGLSFEDFDCAFINAGGDRADIERRGKACAKKWNKLSEMHRRAILEDLTGEKAYFKANPLFLLHDFPEPQPEFLSGEQQDSLRKQGIPLVQVKYNGKFLICTRETKELFNLEWTRDW